MDIHNSSCSHRCRSQQRERERPLSLSEPEYPMLDLMVNTVYII